MKKNDSVMSDLADVGVFAVKSSWMLGKFIVKNAPAAIVEIANAKRELTNVVVDAYNEVQREEKERQIEEKIKQLKKKSLKEPE